MLTSKGMVQILKRNQIKLNFHNGFTVEAVKGSKVLTTYEFTEEDLIEKIKQQSVNNKALLKKHKKEILRVYMTRFVFYDLVKIGFVPDLPKIELNDKTEV